MFNLVCGFSFNFIKLRPQLLFSFVTFEYSQCENFSLLSAYKHLITVKLENRKFERHREPNIVSGL